MNILKLTFLFTLSILFQNASQAQEWVSYQSEQQINDLVETADELLLATDAGLVVMNKATLEKTIFNKGNSNLASNHIQSITTDANGMSWIGTYDAVVQRFNGTDFQDNITLEDIDFNPVTLELYDLEIAANGDIWLGTNQAIFHKEGQSWSRYDETDLGNLFFEAWDIEINNAGEVFVASNGIFKFANGAWSNILGDSELLGYLDADLFFSQSGEMYLSGDLNNIGRYDGEEWAKFSIDFNGSEALKFTEDVDGKIFFNSKQNGIFKLENEEFVVQTDAQTEAFDNESDYFYIDNQNNRWLNNDINLSFNENGNLQTTTISEYTLESNRINKIHTTEDGDLYFIVASSKELAVLKPNGNWSSLQLPSSGISSFEYFNDVLFLADNDIWLVSNDGYYHYDGNAWMFNVLNNCSSIVTDTEGKIYVLSNDKILIINNGVITEYNIDNSPIVYSIISSIGIDADNNLWIGSFDWDAGSAIQKLSTDGIWATYTDADFPVIKRPRGDFHFDNDGNVWIPLGAFGVAIFDGTTWTNPLTGNTDEITNTSVLAVESDANGKLYFAHQYGVTTLLDNEWENLIIEDVPSNLSTGSYITFDEEGTLWWASISYGLFSYSPLDVNTTEADITVAANLLIYPNPATDYGIIDFTIQENAEVNVLIYNNLGQLMLNVALGQLPAGTFQQSINVSDFAKGFYAVQLQVNGRIFTKRMIVQ